MTPYAHWQISREDILLFGKIREVIHKLPDVDLGRDTKGNKVLLSCHMLARAVGEVFQLRVVDGLFYNIYQHSWVTTPKHLIIDVYPIAVLGGPILFDRVNFWGAEELYKEAKLPLDFESAQFALCVRKIKEQLTSPD